MDLNTKQPPYSIGIATAIVTILLSYAYCFTGRSTTYIIANVNIVVNLVTLFVLRKHLLRYEVPSVIASIDWFLAINTVIFLSAMLELFFKSSGNPEFKDALEVMVFFDFLVYCTFLIIGIQLGLRLRRVADDTGLLKLLGNIFIALVPALFVFVSFFVHAGPLKGNVLLHVLSTTLAQAPLVVIILIFYRAKKQVKSILA